MNDAVFDRVRSGLGDLAQGAAVSHGVLVIEVGGLRDAMHQAWPKLPMLWLPTADGLDCVVLMQATDLRAAFAKSPRAGRGR